jgi:alanyl-tRNA synthetase
MAALLENEPRTIAVLASVNDDKLSLVVACGPETPARADVLLRKILGEVGGKGGGDARLAQGGGTAGREKVSALLASAQNWISAGA